MNFEQIINRESVEYNERKDEKLEIINPDISYIEKSSLTNLIEQNTFNNDIRTSVGSKNIENNTGNLTDQEKEKVKNSHPDWPDEIINEIKSWKEYEIYDKANLILKCINGKNCLVRTDIDMEQKDIKGKRNKERMENGLAPLDKDMVPINLHHMGQRVDSPIVELTSKEHRSNGNDSILHNKLKETEVHAEGNSWSKERIEHWETRSRE